MNCNKLLSLFFFCSLTLSMGFGGGSLVIAQGPSAPTESTPDNLEKMKEDLRRDIQQGVITEDALPPPIWQLLFSDPADIQAIDLSNHPEIVSCFDYYTFGSIGVDIASSTDSVVSGTVMDFYGTLNNHNLYPVVEGTLYVKIFKNIGGEKNPNGPDVVDQFIAVDNITIPANGSVPFDFEWQVPAHATSGDYSIGTYFISDKKFNLLGLSFTDDIVGNEFLFTVTGEVKDGLVFDKKSVLINDTPYYFAAYPPRIGEEKDTSISLKIVNTTSEDQLAQTQWKLYKWDAMSESNLVKTFMTEDIVYSGSDKRLSFTLPEKTEPVYLLVGTLKYQDTKSIVNIRYVRAGIDKVRLNYPAVMSYPLKKDEQNTVFTCLHNAGQSSQVQNNTVVLEMRDKKGKVLESYTYAGIVTGDMMAVKKDFKPKKYSDTFTIYASIYTNGELVDESTMEYDCRLINPDICQQTTEDNYLILIGAGILLLLGFASIKMRHKKSILGK